MPTKTLYFDAYNSGEAWSTSPGNMVDGNTGTYASTATAGQVQNLNSLSDLDAIFGQITKVELRGYGYKSGGVQASTLGLRPVFAGGDGPTNNYTLGTTGAWSSWFDITAVTNAPSTWTWADVVGLGCDVIGTPSSGRTVYCSRVEIQVTYTDLAVPGGGLLFGGSPASIVGETGGGTSLTVAAAGAGLLLGGTAATLAGIRSPMVASTGAGLVLGATPGAAEAVRQPTVTTTGAGLLFGASAASIAGVRAPSVATAGGGWWWGATPAGITTTSGTPAQIAGTGGGWWLGATPAEIAADRATTIATCGAGLLLGGGPGSVRARVVPRGSAGAAGLGALGGRHGPQGAGLGHGEAAQGPQPAGLGSGGRRAVGAAGLGHAGTRRPQGPELGSW